LLFLQARDFHALMKKFPDIKEKIDLVVKHRLRALEVWEQYAAKSANATDGMDESETAAAPGGISTRSEEELQQPAEESGPVQQGTGRPEQPASDNRVIKQN